MNIQHLERRVRVLSIFTLILSTLLIMILITGFTRVGQNQRFTEIDVERLNIIGANGELALVLANEARFPGNIMNGLEYSDRSGLHGILFYNAKGDEAGGLIVHSSHEDGVVSAVTQLSLDRYEGDQVLTIRYGEYGEHYTTGMQISDQKLHGLIGWAVSQDSINRLPEAQRPAAMQALRERAYRTGNWEVPRLFIGSENSIPMIDMRDSKGRTRLRMIVDTADVARMEFLDEEGRIVQSVP